MKKMRKLLFGLGVLLVLLAGIAYVFPVPLALAIARKVATQRLASDPVQDLPDGLHVGIFGAGSPLTDDKRSGPCTLVLAGKRLFLFDVGGGSARSIGKMGFNHGPGRRY